VPTRPPGQGSRSAIRKTPRTSALEAAAEAQFPDVAAFSCPRCGPRWFFRVLLWASHVYVRVGSRHAARVRRRCSV
jgi:hypothetical protein